MKLTKFIDYILAQKEFTSMVLFGFSVVLAIMILINIASLFITTVSASRAAKNALAPHQLDANQMEKYLAKSQTIASNLKKKNLFAPNPPPQVTGILGNEALIDNNWYKVGDMVGNAKVIAIEPAQVRLEFEGRELVLLPIESVSIPPPQPGMERPSMGNMRLPGRPPNLMPPVMPGAK